MDNDEITFQTKIPREMPFIFDEGIVGVRMPEWKSSYLVENTDSKSMGERVTQEDKYHLHVIADYFAQKIYSPFNQTAHYSQPIGLVSCMLLNTSLVES